MYCLFEKTKNKQKVAGNGPLFFKKDKSSKIGVILNDCEIDVNGHQDHILGNFTMLAKFSKSFKF